MSALTIPQKDVPRTSSVTPMAPPVRTPSDAPKAAATHRHAQKRKPAAETVLSERPSVMSLLRWGT